MLSNKTILYLKTINSNIFNEAKSICLSWKSIDKVLLILKNFWNPKLVNVININKNIKLYVITLNEYNEYLDIFYSLLSWLSPFKFHIIK